MIVEFILAGFQTIVNVLLFLVPNLPQMPQGIADALAYVSTAIQQMVGVIAYIYTPVVFVFIFTVILAILGFDFIYKFILWVLHKVKG